VHLAWPISVASCTLAIVALVVPAPEARPLDALGEALTFYAPFDGVGDAAYAKGDAAVHWAPSFKERQAARRGLPDGDGVHLARGAGRYGDALRFTTRKTPLVFFHGRDNMPYRADDWSGTVSFWLNVDPEGELEPGFCDPVQITPRAWNDAAFFVEFEKRPEGIPFRLGAYADFSVWNPTKRRFADIAADERPLITVERHPFLRDAWTHVLFTFERFNTGRSDAVVRLYLNGRLQGALGGRTQTFTWDPGQNTIALGLNYIGMMDELAIFDRALDVPEIRRVYELDGGIAALLR
jgi:hypothetical protein